MSSGRPLFVDALETMEYIPDYISNHRGSTMEPITITLNGRGHCNEVISLIRLKTILPSLKPMNDPDADVWIDVLGNNDTELLALGEMFNIHLLTVDDWLTDVPRSKSTIFETYYEITDKEMFYQPHSNIVDYATIHISMRDTFVLTVHSQPLHAVSEVMNDFYLSFNQKLPSAQWVMYTILMKIIKGYKHSMSSIEEDLESIEKLSELNFYTDQHALLARLMDIKIKASNLDYQISPKKALLRYLIKTPTKKISKMVKIYLRDILEEAASVVKRVDFVDDRIDDLTNDFLSKMTLDSYKVNREQGKLMKRFSILTTLFTPPIFFATAFGMNIFLPGQNLENYSMFVLFYVVSGIGMFIGFLYYSYGLRM